jgi:SAM-dependent methyltransferase
MAYELIMDGHLGGCVKGGDTDTWDSKIWDILIEQYNVKSIIDVGCGEGWSSKYFKEKGLDVLGVEGSQLVIENSPNKELLVLHDYTLGSFVPEKQYDAVWSCEFVEHVEEKYVQNFLETFKDCKYVFMTYSEPKWSTGGYHHVNCKDQNYWNEKLSSIGFIWDEEKSKSLREIATAQWVKPTLSIYYKNNL